MASNYSNLVQTEFRLYVYPRRFIQRWSRLTGIDQKKHFTIAKRGPKVVGNEKFRFDISVLLGEEWLKRKLRVRKVVKCLR